MVQTGDPTNTGKGGKSIWGGKFNDEITDSIRHNTREWYQWLILDQIPTTHNFSSLMLL